MVNSTLMWSVSTIPQRESQAPGGEYPDGAGCPTTASEFPVGERLDRRNNALHSRQAVRTIVV